MQVDSFTFLPRSFRPMYENPTPLDEGEVWAPFEKRLADATITLLTSAGLSVAGEQERFDGERERREPMWGDPSHRLIPRTAEQGALGMTHLHVNNEDVLADHEVALPLRALDALAAEGRVGASSHTHISVMGYQQAGLAEWRTATAPAIIEELRSQGADGVILAPV